MSTTTTTPANDADSITLEDGTVTTIPALMAKSRAESLASMKAAEYSPYSPPARLHTQEEEDAREKRAKPQFSASSNYIRAAWADAAVLAKRRLIHELSKEAGLLKGVAACSPERLEFLLLIDAIDRNTASNDGIAVEIDGLSTALCKASNNRP